MQRAHAAVASYLRNAVGLHNLLPENVQKAVLVFDRIWPDSQPPQTNLANPPKVDPLGKKLLNGLVTVTCPICATRVEWTPQTLEELRGIAEDLASFIGNKVCAH